MELKVQEGDWVEEGQTIAILDNHPVSQAEYNAVKVELELAEAKLRREKNWPAARPRPLPSSKTWS